MGMAVPLRDNVAHFDPAHKEGIRDKRPVAAPGNSFRAHQCYSSFGSQLHQFL